MFLLSRETGWSGRAFGGGQLPVRSQETVEDARFPGDGGSVKQIEATVFDLPPGVRHESDSSAPDRAATARKRDLRYFIRFACYGARLHVTNRDRSIDVTTWLAVLS
jgi:hypothetical protein